MREIVQGAPGVTLDRTAYTTEFYGLYREMEGVLWKLERAQHFHEPYSPSWVAWSEGDWDRAMELIEESAGEFAADVPDSVELRRLRIAERPLTAYLRWELQVLKARARAGERTRVLDAGAVRHLERAGPLPEILILSRDLMYEVRYDDIGAHVGGRRIVERDVIAACLAELETLYGQAGDLDPWLADATPSPPVFDPSSPSR
ncbi:DUF6879 family protein [Herbidospora sp. NBRC 101105]|uniref:DUF6879 family protein n=1 Tax=Herbidospora sp. NBRC 101105 TaxID=3032195 RepID=UPI0024A288A6|nr:DUF6879 family protein [Herbidospora sp. NBRC 101105]GLX94370.1 hypothetical protein Hesp01_23200 [Herbidospora sp. NBRC 101105]